MSSHERLAAAVFVLALLALGLVAARIQTDTISHKRAHAVIIR